MFPRAKAGQLIRASREDIGMTQAELAAAAGIHQPTIAAYESGRRTPSEPTLRKLLAAARLRPSIALALLAQEINDAAKSHKLANVRVFGSALEGRDTENSDIDLLVSTGVGASILDLGAFAAEVGALTGFPVDILTETQATRPEFTHVLREAVSL